MHVVDYFGSTPIISFEIIPPLRGDSINNIISLLDELAKYRPPFIDVTSHAAEVVHAPDGIRQASVKKRPGTLGICALIQHHYKTEAVPHVLCKGFTREETEDFLIDLSYLGITNMMALQGDGHQKKIPEDRTANTYAVDLVRQIDGLNQGKYLHQINPASGTAFCIGVAGYPEKHKDAPDQDIDIQYLKEKIKAGAQYIVTQMFFDNKYYFDFVRKCRDAGIAVPIVPGLKILSSPKQLISIPDAFNVNLPDDLIREVSSTRVESALEVGVSWAYQQAEGLLQQGAPGIHLYVMQNAKPVQLLMKKMGV